MEILLPAMHSWLVCNHYDHGVDDDSDDDVVDDEVDDDRGNDVDDHLSQQSDVTRILHRAHSQLLPEKKMKKLFVEKIVHVAIIQTVESKVGTPALRKATVSACWQLDIDIMIMMIESRRKIYI